VIGRPHATIAAALALGGMLSGCVAAVIPVAAAGTIGKRKLDGPKRKKERTRITAPVVPTTPLPGTEIPATARLQVLPAGSALPAPDGSTSGKPGAPAPEAGWRALVRHVARAMTSGASCPDGKTAVLIDASVAKAGAAERDAAVASLNALRTMGASVTFIAADPVAAKKALSAAGMAEPDAEVSTAAAVRPIARSGCVVASGGGERRDYTGLAWFALPGAAVVAERP